jgi:predicted Zn-dependent protease
MFRTVSAYSLFIAAVVSLIGCTSKPETDSDAESTQQASEDKQASSSDPPSYAERSSSDTSSKTTSTSTDSAFANKLTEVERLRAANETDAAWELVKELLIERPKSSPATFLAARIMAQRKNLQGAIQMISRIDPNDPEAGLPAIGQLAEWLAQSGNLAEAELKAKTVLAAYPASVPANRLLADIYHAQGRRWEAYRMTERLIRLGSFSTPDLMNAVDTREPVDITELRLAAKRFAPDDPYNRFADLRMLTGANRWSDAVDDLKTLTTENPKLLEPWIWYGEALVESERWSGIPEWLSNAPQGYQQHPEYWYILGRIQEIQQNFPQAARCYAEALRIDRRHLAAMQSLSVALTAMQQSDLAADVRVEAGKLVRIKDLFQQIQRGLGKRDAFAEMAMLYRELGDELGAFGWDAITLADERKPIPEELVAMQKRLRAGAKVECRILGELPIDSWPLPDQRIVAPTMMDRSDVASTSYIPIRLRDVAADRGVNAAYNNGAEPVRGWTTVEGLGGGVSAIDYDRDGWVDLFFSQAGDNPMKPVPTYQPKSLYRSIHSQLFIDIADAARVAHRGFGQGTGVADIDQDGFDDLLVADIGQISCFRNQGDGTFEAIPLPQAPAPAFWNSSIQAADLNGDSLPDIVQGAYIHGEDVYTRRCPTAQNPNLVFCHPKRFEPGKSRILFNQGDGAWTLAPDSILDSLVDGYALGTLITDLDGTGGNDVFFANDVSANHLLLSRRASDNRLTLEEVGMRAGVAVDALGRSQASMGIACGDQNRDGLLDIIVTNFRYEDSTLYMQVSPGVFIDGTRTARLGEFTREWLSFGCQLADLDNDGWLDFITVNGHIDMLTPWKMPPQVLYNRQGKFEWLKQPSPGEYFDVDNVGRSLTMADLDRDGRLDFAVTHLDRAAAMLINESTSSSNTFLQLELVGVQSQREAIGARVVVRSGDQRWVAPLAVGDGFYGTNERLVHVGLGNASQVDAVEIAWPSGHQEIYRDLKPGLRYRAIEKIGIESVDIAHGDRQ